MIFQFFIRFRAIALMIMPVGLDCGFEFEKGGQLLICMHNKASSVAALCGHNPNWSAFAIGSRHRAAIPSSVAEILDDNFQYFTRRLQPCRDWSTSSKDFGSTSLMNLKLDKLSLDHLTISPIPLPTVAAP